MEAARPHQVLSLLRETNQSQLLMLIVVSLHSWRSMPWAAATSRMTLTQAVGSVPCQHAFLYVRLGPPPLTESDSCSIGSESLEKPGDSLS